MTTTLKNLARGLNFNSSRDFYGKLSGFEAQGCISTRSRVILFTDKQTDKQTTRFTFADPLASLLAQPNKFKWEILGDFKCSWAVLSDLTLEGDGWRMERALRAMRYSDLSAN